MIGAAIVAVLMIVLASCLLFVAVAAALLAVDEFWRYLKSRRPLPMAETREVRLVTDLNRWRALRGSGSSRFSLSEWK